MHLLPNDSKPLPPPPHAICFPADTLLRTEQSPVIESSPSVIPKSVIPLRRNKTKKQGDVSLLGVFSRGLGSDEGMGGWRVAGPGAFFWGSADVPLILIFA